MGRGARRLRAARPPHDDPAQNVADLCQKLVELNLLRFAGDDELDRKRLDVEAVGVADSLHAYEPLPAIYLASAYARLWIEASEQNGADPLAAWQVRNGP